MIHFSAKFPELLVHLCTQGTQLSLKLFSSHQTRDLLVELFPRHQTRDLLIEFLSGHQACDLLMKFFAIKQMMHLALKSGVMGHRQTMLNFPFDTVRHIGLNPNLCERLVDEQ